MVQLSTIGLDPLVYLVVHRVQQMMDSSSLLHEVVPPRSLCNDWKYLQLNRFIIHCVVSHDTREFERTKLKSISKRYNGRC
jgi:hypothetical protein